MAELQVQIVTPAGIVYDHRASRVIVKSTDGQLGILPGHTPIIVPLTIDGVRIERVSVEKEDLIAVNGGIMEMRDNVCSIIADSAERARDIDVERAFAAKQRAEEKIRKAESVHNSKQQRRAEVSLRKAINRISVSKKNK